MEEKGKNLATKEDIKGITEKTEEVKVQFKKEFHDFSSDNEFKQEYYHQQFSGLYSKLYSIISQSEYYRYFNSLYGDKKANFDEYPFFEVSKSTKKEKSNLFTGEILQNQVIEVNDSITGFNKKELCDYIIANSNLASRRLLKIAVAYRFANDHYSRSETKISDKKMSDGFDKEELRLIRELVKIIISDYNIVAKKLKLDYNKIEMETGLFQHEELSSNTIKY
ncbi:hypothetical protein [Clostridium gasigenes]|nr:hypothetical protein [Clostridium gasigenes]